MALIASILALSTTAFAENKDDAVASINGVSISKTLLEQNVKLAISRGQKDSPELRLTLKEDLINRELLSQESVKEGLDKSADTKLMLDQARRNILVDVMLNDYFNKHPVSEADIKAEYDKQVASVGNDAQQYKISHIVLATESEAKDVLAKAKKGDAFGQLAKQYSIDNAGNNEGAVDWVLPTQIVPELSNVMVNLAKGTIAISPIQTSTGWHIIKLDDKRAFKAPTFDEAKNNVKVGLIMKKQAEYVMKLRESAKIFD